ncbi:DNA-binding protein [Lutibacter sp. HS1-25]|uniref:DNA-binding protein n=1 Tax=Lutibacter sp. HS1-25 TaxID=2485000 RepID=UPI001010EA6D|nr:DNA-binding protein [Lutibacter sp. HS1-25]RXP55752.1 DNA-binding protein [Lutibacter sp. HS1-25]
MRNKIKFLVVVASVFVFFGCKDKQGYSKMDTAPVVSENATHKIVVNEFMDAAGYTYINVSEENENYWMAIPATKVEKGATYYYAGGMLMKDFTSKELDKTFDFITFAEGISTSESTLAKPKEHVHTDGDNHTANEPNVTDIKIEKANGGVSVGELYANPASFSTKVVIVKGEVVKVNNGILDKNWVHIVDGSNFEGKNDLTITTKSTVKVGDVVTFKAKVTLDKDFGAGYVYPLLLEDGEIVE